MAFPDKFAVNKSMEEDKRAFETPSMGGQRRERCLWLVYQVFQPAASFYLNVSPLPSRTLCAKNELQHVGCRDNTLDLVSNIVGAAKLTRLNKRELFICNELIGIQNIHINSQQK